MSNFLSFFVLLCVSGHFKQKKIQFFFPTDIPDSFSQAKAWRLQGSVSSLHVTQSSLLFESPFLRSFDLQRSSRSQQVISQRYHITFKQILWQRYFKFIEMVRPDHRIKSRTLYNHAGFFRNEVFPLRTKATTGREKKETLRKILNTNLFIHMCQPKSALHCVLK